MIKPHDYQNKAIVEIIEKFKTKDSLVLQSDTGSGKTVIFSFLAKEWTKNNKGKILILCNRSELIQQSCDTLVKIGLTYEKILPKTKRLHHNSDVYVAMVETLYRRLLRNQRYLNNISLIIADECHYMSFPKIFSFFKSKVLGVTATPVLLGRDTFYKCDRCRAEYDELGMCCGRELIEWSRPKKLSDTYEDIVVGPKIDFLIEMGQLVKEVNFVKKYIDISKLEVDDKGEFSNNSQDKAFGDSEAVFNCRLNYEQLAKGKRTVIFNNSTKTNIKVYEDFKNAGYDVKMYDSVNTTDETRQDIVKWFKETDGAILCNVATFLAGFDARNIECVILNVATLSIAKYLQAVGRGGRSCDEIYKPHFILIDGGGNVERFDPWSSPTRDWTKMFFEGIGAPPRAKKEQPLNVQECKECGMYFSRSDSVCPECGSSVPIPKPREKTLSDDVLTPLEKLPPPNGKKIADYTARREENIHFGFKILGEYILDMFRFYGVDADLFSRSLASGKVDKRITELVRPVYFTLIKDERFVGDSNRTLKQVTKKVREKICSYYGV